MDAYLYQSVAAQDVVTTGTALSSGFQQADVAAISLQSADLADGTGMSDLLRQAESGTEPTLMIEGQLHIGGLAGFHHRFRVAECGGHWFFAVNGH